MSRILIVEDTFLRAVVIEDAVRELGHDVVGIAASRPDVCRIEEKPDIALVDVNLLDGPTGPGIGRDLAAAGCCVIFMTANPEAVADGVAGALGVISKPVPDLDLVGVIQYAVSCCEGGNSVPPKSFRAFPRTLQ